MLKMMNNIRSRNEYYNRKTFPIVVLKMLRVSFGSKENVVKISDYMIQIRMNNSKANILIEMINKTFAWLDQQCDYQLVLKYIPSLYEILDELKFIVKDDRTYDDKIVIIRKTISHLKRPR